LKQYRCSPGGVRESEAQSVFLMFCSMPGGVRRSGSKDCVSICCFLTRARKGHQGQTGRRRRRRREGEKERRSKLRCKKQNLTKGMAKNVTSHTGVSKKRTCRTRAARGTEMSPRQLLDSESHSLEGLGFFSAKGLEQKRHERPSSPVEQSNIMLQTDGQEAQKLMTLTNRRVEI